jgi:hypothetical protein
MACGVVSFALARMYAMGLEGPVLRERPYYGQSRLVPANFAKSLIPLIGKLP